MNSKRKIFENDNIMRMAMHMLGGSTHYLAPESRWLIYTFKGVSFWSYGMRTPIDAPEVIEKANNKMIARFMCEAAEVPVMEWTLLDLIAPPFFSEDHEWVLKPIAGTRGNGVFARLKGSDIHRCCEVLNKTHRYAMLEPFVEGRLYRILLLDGALMGIYEKILPSLLGDGKRSVEELLNDRNKNNLLSFSIDAEVEYALSKQGLTRLSIPDRGRIVIPTYVGNLSRGASWKPVHDIADWIHLISVCRQAAAVVQLRLAGVDMIIDGDGRARILEVNPSPGIVGVSHDADGSKVDLRVAQKIILKCLEFAGSAEDLSTSQETVLDIERYNRVLSEVN